MKSTCSFCKKHALILERDFARGSAFTQSTEILTCIDCFKKFMPERINEIKKCPRCKESFLKNEDWQKICLDCWRKEKCQKK